MYSSRNACRIFVRVHHKSIPASDTYQEHVDRFEPAVESIKTIKEIFDNDTAKHKAIIDEYTTYLAKTREAINMIDIWIDSNITYYAQLPGTISRIRMPGGTLLSRQCAIFCPAGSFSRRRECVLAAVLCPPGYYQPMGSSTCLNCSTGFHESNICKAENASRWEEMIYKSPIETEYENNTNKIF